MAYEQKIQKLVLFGGASGFTVLGDYVVMGRRHLHLDAGQSQDGARSFRGKASFDSRGVGNAVRSNEPPVSDLRGKCLHTTKFYGDTWTLIGK
jgi:hypothetical protein